MFLLNYSELKKSLVQKDIKTSAQIISQLFLKNTDSFRKGVLLSGCLPDPLNEFNFKEKEHIIDTFYQACELVAKVMEKHGFETAEFKDVYISLIFSHIAIANHNKSNVKKLSENEFLKLPYEKQIQMFCVFLENQNRLSNEITRKEMKEKKFYTGMETHIAKELPNDNRKQSLNDNIEAGIEVANTLFKYIFYLSGNNLEIQNIEFMHEDVCPYEIPSFEEVGLLAQHRNMLEHLWEKIKFSNWDYTIYGTNDDKTYFFTPPDERKYKLQRTAIERYRYKDFLDFTNKMRTNYQRFEKAIKKVEVLSGDFSLDEVRTLFEIDKDKFNEVGEGFNVFIEVSAIYLEYSVDFWFGDISIGKNNNIKIKDILELIKYFYTIAFIYQKQSHTDFNDDFREGYRLLAPVVKIEWIVQHFSKVSSIEPSMATDIIDLFIFKPKTKLDLFSQPLVYVGNNRVIFTPALLKQLNVPRIIEQQLGVWGKDISDKGVYFENIIRELVSINPNMKINTNQIKFTAYDGKQVEFDFIGIFENNIYLMEMKCLKKPYSDRELKDRQRVVDEGIEQIIRRTNVIKHDWEHIRQLVNISLPESPPNATNIIKVLCLNIFEYTGFNVDDIHIIDISSLSKFFNSPKIKVESIYKGKVSVYSEKSLWSKEYPTVRDFRSYLRQPETINSIYEALEPVPQPVLLIEEDNYKLASQDFVLSRFPFSDNENLALIKKKKPRHKRKKSRKRK